MSTSSGNSHDLESPGKVSRVHRMGMGFNVLCIGLLRGVYISESVKWIGRVECLG